MFEAEPGVQNHAQITDILLKRNSALSHVKIIALSHVCVWDILFFTKRNLMLNTLSLFNLINQLFDVFFIFM